MSELFLSHVSYLRGGGGGGVQRECSAECLARGKEAMTPWTEHAVDDPARRPTFPAPPARFSLPPAIITGPAKCISY